MERKDAEWAGSKSVTLQTSRRDSRRRGQAGKDSGWGGSQLFESAGENNLSSSEALAERGRERSKKKGGTSPRTNQWGKCSSPRKEKRRKGEKGRPGGKRKMQVSSAATQSPPQPPRPNWRSSRRTQAWKNHWGATLKILRRLWEGGKKAGRKGGGFFTALIQF